LAIFPFTSNISTGELKEFAPGTKRQASVYSAGGEQRQVSPYNEQFEALAKFGFGSAAVAAGFYTAQRAGLKPLDYLYSGVRAAEDFSPAQIFRTFSVGDFLSQYTSANLTTRHITPAQVDLLRGTSWFDDLMYRVGHEKGLESVLHGLTFTNNKLYAGNTLLLDNARILTSTGTPNLAAAYSRSLGFEGLPEVPSSERLKIPIKYRNEAGAFAEEVFYFTGARDKKRAAINQGHAFLTEWVQRANRLAESPFEMEPFSTGTGKARFAIRKWTGLDPTLAVKSGAALPTLSRMAFKWGIGGTAAYLGYQTADWAVKQSSIFDSTILAEGITAGIATIGTRINLGASSIADSIPGMRSYQEWQEESAPGSTSLQKLAAVPLSLAFAGLTGSYLVSLSNRVSRTKEIMKGSPDISFTQALHKADALVKEDSVKFGAQVFDDLTGGRFKDRIPFIGKIGQAKRMSFIGAAIGTALILPFLPGALIPEKTEQELEDIYSGKTEVAVRKGRFWEMGRSAWEGGRIDYYRPHWYPRMLQDSFDKSMGIEDRSPIHQWYLENFTNQIEKEHYYDRPYPITGTPFEDIPIIGPLLGATIGRLFKPPQLMHTEEWMGGSELESNTPVIRIPGRLGTGVVMSRGDVPQGTPVQSTELKQVLGEQSYRLTELSGLVGFTGSSIKGAITGESEWFDQEERLQTARSMYGSERAYWDLSIGGGVGTCFIAGTPIKTLETIKPIEEVKVGDLVLSSGDYREVKNILIKNPTESCLTIKTKSLKTEFTCTKNHWIPVLRRHCYSGGHPKPFEEGNYDLLEVQASELRKGDYLFYEISQKQEDVTLEIIGGKSSTENYVYYQASQQFAFGYEALENRICKSRSDLRKIGIPDKIAKEVLRQFRENKLPKRIRRFVEIDSDLAYAIGWYIAEGCSDGQKLTYTMHANELSFAERIAQTFKRIFDVNSSIEIENNTLRLDISSCALARTLDLFGHCAKNKKIPESFKNLPNDKLKSLVTGLILGDGWEKGFTSVSRQLVKDLADCLLKLGYQVNIVLDYTEKASGFYPQGTSRKACKRNYLRIVEGTKQPWRFWKTSYLVKIDTIAEVQSPSIVYDLTINDIHYYTADGIVVHNTEFFRRLYPHRRRQIDEYNPIRNTMPDWLPGPGDKSPDFLHGDPFTKIPEGELRLPGEGYAARFKELEGLDPADYPLIHQYRILSDIAPYSDKFKEAEQRLKSARKKGELSEEELEIWDTIQARTKEVKNSRKNFFEYEVFSQPTSAEIPGFKQSEELLTAINNNIRNTEPKSGIAGSLMKGYWETLVAGIGKNPLEALTPIAPASKLMHEWTAIEDYKRTRVFGPDIAFWEHPIDNFILPAIRETFDMFGITSVPDDLQEQRNIEEYFDALEYKKNKKLADLSRDRGEWETAKLYETAAQETLLGNNPYSRNYRSIFRALPRSDRDFFNAFSQAKTLEEKEEILKIIPENQKRIYQAQWEMLYADQIRKQIKDGVISGDIKEKAEQELSRLYQKREFGGFDVSPELLYKFENRRNERQNYSDWYRENIILKNLEEDTGILPGPDWVGWHPSVDLDDVKLKVVKNAGLDIHAFDLWESDEKAALQKDYLDAIVTELEHSNVVQEESSESVKEEVHKILADLEITGTVKVVAVESNKENNDYTVVINVSENRSDELAAKYRELE
jgi:intein/homing endonuclease